MCNDLHSAVKSDHWRWWRCCVSTSRWSSDINAMATARRSSIWNKFVFVSYSVNNPIRMIINVPISSIVGKDNTECAAFHCTGSFLGWISLLYCSEIHGEGTLPPPPHRDYRKGVVAWVTFFSCWRGFSSLMVWRCQVCLRESGIFAQWMAYRRAPDLKSTWWTLQKTCWRCHPDWNRIAANESVMIFFATLSSWYPVEGMSLEYVQTICCRQWGIYREYESCGSGS